MLVAGATTILASAVSATVLGLWKKPPKVLASWMGGLAVVSALGSGMTYHVASAPEGTSGGAPLINPPAGAYGLRGIRRPPPDVGC